MGETQNTILIIGERTKTDENGEIPLKIWCGGLMDRCLLRWSAAEPVELAMDDRIRSYRVTKERDEETIEKARAITMKRNVGFKTKDGVG